MKFVKGLIVVAVVLAICAAVPEVRAEALPTFSLAWSEYPSWSAFGVAHEVKLINGKKGKLGPIEKKWGVDIVLKEAEYDPCLMMYGAGQVDAVCITNMDVLPPSLGIQSVAILPTSTSYGADACIVTSGITAARQLRGRKVYGLAKTVSEYCFVRNLEIQGESEKTTFSPIWIRALPQWPCSSGRRGTMLSWCGIRLSSRRSTNAKTRTFCSIPPLFPVRSSTWW